MVNCHYPVVADFCSSTHGSIGAIHQNQLSLPSHFKHQHMKVTPVTSDKSLLGIFECVAQFMQTVVPKVALNFPSLVIKLQWEWKFTISSISSSPPYEPGPPTFDKEGVVPGDSTYVLSIHDVLLQLNAAQLYSNRLAEMLQRKSHLADTIERWRSFKKFLIEFSIFIDKVLQSYTHDSCTYPEVNELKKINNRLINLISRASIDKIKEMFEDGISVSEFDLVTAALGLDGSISSAVCEIRQGTCNHQTDQYHIQDIVCKAVEDNCLKYDPVKEVMTILVASGFSNSRASILAENLQQDELSSLQPLTYWVECYLDYMFEYDIFLNSEHTCFPFNADKVNEWFVVPRILDNDSTDEMDDAFVNVHIYNTTDGLDAITRDGVTYPHRVVEESLWYHATDHKSAQSILLDGIRLKEGKAKQDFSHKSGFYLTPHLDFAKEWARRKGGPRGGAVIVFKHKLDATAYRGLDLSPEENVNKWKQVVKYYRCGQKSRLFVCPKSLATELNKTDFIEGPMSWDQRKCASTDWQPNKREGASRQLCIKSQKLADEFSSGIDAIIFLSTNSNYLK